MRAEGSSRRARQGRLAGAMVALAVVTTAHAQRGLLENEAPLVALPAGWRAAPELMAGFPRGLQVYSFEGTLAGNTRAVCVAWDPEAPGIVFKPTLAPAPRTVPQFIAQEPGRVFAAANSGFFGGNQSFSLVQHAGTVLSPNVKALARTFQGAGTNYFPTRAAFGITPAGGLTVDWIYHVGTGNDLIYAYPQPSPNRLNTAPQPVPTATFPEGAARWVMEQGVGGSPLLVKDGVVRITDAEELIEVNNTSRRARTALGYTAAGIVLLVAVEGNIAGGGDGMTLAEVAALMRNLGCVGAVNLDGGGSTALVAGGRATVRPSDGQDRPVLSALVLADAASTSAATAAPAIAQAPWDVRVARGAPATLQVAATGGGLSYQWFKDGVALPGATQAALTWAAAASADAGGYSVVVTNARGRAESRRARLEVAPGRPAEIGNLSVRAIGGAGEDSLIAGFVLRDAPATLLLRAIGPTLAGFGVAGALPDPRLELVAGSGAVLGANDDWEPAVAAAAAGVGAFALPAGSADAALVRTVAAGAATVAATPARGATRGGLLVEVYQTAGAGALANLSARARVAGDGGELIAGFVVRGEQAITVLVRATGPALRTLGVGDALPAPRLTLVRDGEVWLANAGWAQAPNAADVREAARRTGAFALPLRSADAAMLVTLPPGAYSAVVAPATGATGVALVEVYEVR